MSNQVWRYNSKKEYLDPLLGDQGTPVSKKFDTFDEAARVRDLLAEGESRYFYGIRHYSSVAIVNTTNKKGEQING